MGILDFHSLSNTSRCCTTKQDNTEEGDSYIPSTSQPRIHLNPPFLPHQPYLEACSKGLAEVFIGKYGDGNEVKLLLRDGGNPGYRRQRIRGRGGYLTPLFRSGSLCATPGEGAYWQDQRHRS